MTKYADKSDKSFYWLINCWLFRLLDYRHVNKSIQWPIHRETVTLLSTTRPTCIYIISPDFKLVYRGFIEFNLKDVVHYGYQQINIVKKIYRSTITKMVIFYKYNNNLILILTVSAFIAINSNMFIITTDTENPCPYEHFRSSPLIIFKSKQDFYILFIPFFSLILDL